MINGEQMVKVEKYRVLNTMVKEGQILFTGSSLMEQFPINELQMDFGIKEIIYNRGIGGFTTDNMLQCMDEQIFGVKPSKIFINIGTNDISDPNTDFDILLKEMLKNYIYSSLNKTNKKLVTQLAINCLIASIDVKKYNNCRFLIKEIFRHKNYIYLFLPYGEFLSG